MKIKLKNQIKIKINFQMRDDSEILTLEIRFFHQSKNPNPRNDSEFH